MGETPAMNGWPVVVASGEVPADHVTGHRQEPTVRALGRLMRGFSQTPRTHSLAHAGADPELLVFRLSKPPWVDVLAAAEDRPEECDLVVRGRESIDETRNWLHWAQLG